MFYIHIYSLTIIEYIIEFNYLYKSLLEGFEKITR